MNDTLTQNNHMNNYIKGLEYEKQVKEYLLDKNKRVSAKAIKTTMLPICS